MDVDVTASSVANSVKFVEFDSTVLLIGKIVVVEMVNSESLVNWEIVVGGNSDGRGLVTSFVVISSPLSVVEMATLISTGFSVPRGRVTGGNVCDSADGVASEVCSKVNNVGVFKSLVVEVNTVESTVVVCSTGGFSVGVPNSSGNLVVGSNGVVEKVVGSLVVKLLVEVWEAENSFSVLKVGSVSESVLSVKISLTAGKPVVSVPKLSNPDVETKSVCVEKDWLGIVVSDICSVVEGNKVVVEDTMSSVVKSDGWDVVSDSDKEVDSISSVTSVDS